MSGFVTTGVEELDGRVALHAILVADRLAGRRAVHITDDNRLGVRVGRTQRVPIGLHLLAVASPRRLELDEGLDADIGGGREGGGAEGAQRVSK